LLVPALLLVRPGYLPPALISLVLPIAALLAAYLATVVWEQVRPAERTRHDLGRPSARSGLAVAGGVVLVLALVGPGWLSDTRALLDDEPEAATAEAGEWLATNLPPGSTLVVGEVLRADLVDDGVPAARLVPYGAVDGDPDLVPGPRAAWQDQDIVVVDGQVRAFPEGHPGLTAAAAQSVAVARFGTGDDRVEVRRVLPEGAAAAGASGEDRSELRDAARAGEALARNDALDLSDAARAALVAGEVDERMMTALAALAADHRLGVASFPDDPAEVVPGAGRRRAVLVADDHARASRIAAVLAGQDAPFRPAHVDLGSGGRVTVTYVPEALL
jgi:hypothetical protein